MAPDPPQPSRRWTLSRGAAALAAACGLGACGGRPEIASREATARQNASVLSWVLDGTRPVVVAGEPLDDRALRRFYAQRDFEPVWTGRGALATTMTNTVLRAGEHGLDPELFRASLLRRRESFPALRRELLLTDAVLSYAGALAHGAVPTGQRKEYEALRPAQLDVAAAVETALGNRDPAAAIEALAPATPTYQALCQAVRRQRSGSPGGAAAIAARLRTIEVNLERQRWLPRPLPADRVWVNVADQRLVLYRGDRPTFTTRVVVGEDVTKNQSPEFNAVIEASFFNPPWVIPKDIVDAEILPRISRDPTYLARNNMVLRPNGEVEQMAGPNAGLGYLMFDMPNRFDVYLHDTPDRHIFNRDNRRISHGCIRVQNPRELAALLLQEPLDAVDRGIAAGGTTRNRLPTPVPVFVTYETAFADPQGAVQFRPDFYNRDADVWRRMQKRPAA